MSKKKQQSNKSDVVQISIEYFDVLYTKHLRQKAKIWEDGFMEYNSSNHKILLYCATQRANCIDTKFYRSIPDLSVGEEFRMNKYLVQIEKRRLEGKSSV